MTWKVNFFKTFTWKIYLNSPRNLKRPKNEIVTLKSYLKQENVALTPTQHYLVWIRFQRKISFVTSFTISKWLKKYLLYIELSLSDQDYNKIYDLIPFNGFTVGLKFVAGLCNNVETKTGYFIIRAVNNIIIYLKKFTKNIYIFRNHLAGN